MIVSMTGFGRGEAARDGITLTVEMKSVNSRFLDLSMRLPQVVQQRELDLKELVQGQIRRGKVNVTVRMDSGETGDPGITFNPHRVRGYMQLLEDLREKAGIEEPVSLKTLMEFNDLFTTPEQDTATVERVAELMFESARQALEQLSTMRRQEGAQLEADLRGRLEEIERLLEEIKRLASGRTGEVREKLLERIRGLVSEETLDQNRLEMEVAILAEKMDIEEEIVRLRAHLKFFREAFERDQAVGRRLNFLSQEMNREVNTIGSKANHSEISRCVVEAKESLEQIREQVQNIE